MTQTEETRLRLALGNALHQIQILQLSHGDDFDRDDVNIATIRTILSEALKDPAHPVDTNLYRISVWIIILVHGICFACLLVFGFLIKF